MSLIWREPSREDRHVAWLWAMCAALLLLFRPVWLVGARLAPSCVWHAWTGWPCPGCGSTRALSRLLHADLLGAFAFNPLAVVGASVFVAAGLIAPVWLLCGGPAPSLAGRPRPAWLAALGTLVLANWAWLCASGV